MATGKRREDRLRVVDQAFWVAAMFGDKCSEWSIANYVSRGSLPDGSDKESPQSDDVDAKVAEIQQTGKVTF